MPSAQELRELEDEELETRLGEYRRELFNLRFQLATGQLDNIARVNDVRKDVARILTLLRDREIAAAEGHPILPLPHVERVPKPPRPSRRRRDEEDEVTDGEPDEDEVYDEDAQVDDEGLDEAVEDDEEEQ